LPPSPQVRKTLAATRSWLPSTQCTRPPKDVRDTDWSQVVALYDQLARIDPSPIVALNRAVALAELDGPEVALAIVDRLDLGGYHAYHATRADLLRRLGRSTDARAAYDKAIELAGNTAEVAYLTRRRDQLRPHRSYAGE
jgi:RNA polymerase sigma-70 factor (ECF subfamily)